MVTRAKIPWEPGIVRECGCFGQRCKIKYMRGSHVHKDDNMADPVEEQGDDNFSLPAPSSRDSDTEVVLRREVLDSFLSPNEESSGELVDKFDHGLENWRWKPNSPVELEKTFYLDGDSHIESIEDKCNDSRDEKSARTSGVQRTDSAVLDSEKVTENGRLRKTLESHVDKSPEMEFRHRYSNNDKLSSREEEARVIHSSEHVDELVEPEAKSYKKDEEDPSIREEASEQRIQDDHDLKSKGSRIANLLSYSMLGLLSTWVFCTWVWTPVTSLSCHLICFICYQSQSS